MLSCKGHERGCFIFFCEHCKKEFLVAFGCNSRICSCCGKRYTDKWADMLSKKVSKNIIHRHIVFGIPDMLWNYFKKNKELRKVLMDTAHETLEKFFSSIAKRKIEIGSIEAIHSFGRDIKFQPHIHSIVTEGGYALGKFISIGRYMGYDGLHRKWQYEILNALKKYLPKNIINEAFWKYPKGFCVYVRPEQIKSSRQLARYIGRYVRHPAIANSRIIAYNGEAVKFYYEDNKEKIHNKIMLVHDFISAIIQHIPEKHERLVRYYGCYSRRKIRKTKENVKQSIIEQRLLCENKKKRIVLCPICFQEAKLMIYCKKPPPENKGRLDYWTI